MTDPCCLMYRQTYWQDHERDCPARVRQEVLAHRRALCQTRTATLDGHPAVIGGAAERFATVSTLTGITSGQWAWETVESIVRRNGGEFQS